MSALVPIHVLGNHVFDVYVMEMDDSVDLDFVLCDPAVGEKDRIVDYSWLPLETKPRFRLGDSISRRRRHLIAWIERSYLDKCTRDLPNVLPVYSKAIGFEYEAYLQNIANESGRRVEGIVRPSSDGVLVTFSIPLLLHEEERAREIFTTVVQMYAKALRTKLSTVPHFPRVEFALLITCAARDRDAGLKATAERITMRVEDDSADRRYEEFIQSCFTFSEAPKYSITPHRGAGFMDYIPTLERSIMFALREPRHFLTLVITMSSYFGTPISVSVGASDLSKGGGALVRVAAYCVLDRATQVSFTIMVRYHGGRKLPTVGIIANQYPRSGESTLRMKVQYPEALLRLERECGLDDLLDVMAVSDAIERCSFEGMSFLISTCQ